jgi:hypothetical protein
LLPASATPTTKGLDVTDFPSVAKKVTKDGATNPSMSTFQVAILPTKQQRRVLQAMLRVSNVAYNWAGYLVTKCNFRPSLYGLQKVVARTSKDEKAATAKRKALDAIPDQYVPDFAEYVFQESVGMTQHRLLAAKQYVKDHELCAAKKKERRKKCQYLIEHGHTEEIKDKKRKELEKLEVKYSVKPRPMGTTNITTGTFGIQKLQCFIVFLELCRLLIPELQELVVAPADECAVAGDRINEDNTRELPLNTIYRIQGWYYARSRDECGESCGIVSKCYKTLLYEMYKISVLQKKPSPQKKTL